MSFILDALKKSETDRQQQAGAEFSSVPSSSGEPQSLKWLWILGLLLLVNFAFLVAILLRPENAADEPPAAVVPAAEPAAVSQPTFEDKIAAAKENQPAQTDNDPVPASAETEAQIRQSASQPAAAPSRGRVLTIDEARLNGSLQLDDLHLDIHVYSDNPAERFVFINMAKHREQSQLDEGPVVAEITPDGVILEYQGMTFLLPRE